LERGWRGRRPRLQLRPLFGAGELRLADRNVTRAGAAAMGAQHDPPLLEISAGTP